MEHIDWKAWDMWMEAHDGCYMSPEEVTRKADQMNELPAEREKNIADMHKFNRDVAALEESRLHASEKDFS